MPVALRGRIKASDLLELKLQIIVSYSVGAGILTWVLYKSTSTLNHRPIPLAPFPVHLKAVGYLNMTFAPKDYTLLEDKTAMKCCSTCHD